MYRPFGRRLREARLAGGLTQAQLGDAVGLSRTSITNIERGRQATSLHALYLLAEAVGVEPSELLPARVPRSRGREELQEVFSELSAEQAAAVRLILDEKVLEKDVPRA